MERRSTNCHLAWNKIAASTVAAAAFLSELLRVCDWAGGDCEFGVLIRFTEISTILERQREFPSNYEQDCNGVAGTRRDCKGAFSAGTVLNLNASTRKISERRQVHTNVIYSNEKKSSFSFQETLSLSLSLKGAFHRRMCAYSFSQLNVCNWLFLAFVFSFRRLTVLNHSFPSSRTVC